MDANGIIVLRAKYRNMSFTDGEIVELTSEEELREAYLIVDQLRPVGEEQFLELVSDMQEESGYQLFALKNNDGSMLAVAGVVIQTNLYHGRHAWVHDLVVDEPNRGKGHGSALLSWVFDWADERDCSCVELASGLWRDDAHQFYEDLDMEKYCYTFKKGLEAQSPY